MCPPKKNPSSNQSVSGSKDFPISNQDIPSQAPPEAPTSYEIFIITIKRANNLVSFHSGDTECQEHHYDSFRAAIVLSISALDAYVRTLVVEKILDQLTDRNRNLTDELKKFIKDIVSPDSLFEAARKYEFRESVEKAIRSDFETKSFQGGYKIEFYLSLVGYKNIFNTVAHSLNFNTERLRGDIERFTKRRHVIAHCGDFELNQIPHTQNHITKEYATECIKTVELFAEHLDKVTRK